MDSMEYKLTQFQNSVTQFWQTAINTENVKDLIDSGTRLMQTLTLLIDNIGLLPPVIAVVSLAFMSLSNTMRTTLTSASLFNGQIMSLTGSLTLLGKTAKTVGLFLARALPITAILTGATIVVQKFYSHIMKLKREEAELKQYNDDLVDSWKNNRNEINSLIDRYKVLNERVNQGLISENSKEYIEVQNKLNELLPSLTDKIDEQGNAHLKNVDAIKQEINYVKNLKEKYDELYLTEFEEKQKDRLNNLKDINNEIEKLSKPPKKASYQVNYGTPEAERDRIKREIQLNQKQQERVRLIEKERNEISKLIQTQLKSANITKDLSNYQNQYLDKLIEKNIKYNNVSDWDKNTEQIQKQITTLINAENQIKKFAESQEDGSLNTDLFNQSISKLKEEFKKADIPVYVLNELIDEYINKTKHATENTEDLIHNAISMYKSFVSEIQDLADAYQTLSEGEQLSVNTITELIEKHPELINAIESENGVLSINKDAIIELYNVKSETYTKELEMEKNKLLTLQNNLPKILSYIRDQAIAYKELGDALETLLNLQAQFFNQYRQMSPLAAMGPNKVGFVGYVEKQAGSIQNNIDAINALINSVNGGISNFTSKSSSSKNNYLDKIFQKFPAYQEKAQDLINKTNQLSEEIDKLNTEITIAELLGNTEKQIQLEQQLNNKLYEREIVYRDIKKQLISIGNQVEQEFQKHFGNIFSKQLSNLTEVEIKKYFDTLEEKIIKLENQLGHATGDAIKKSLQKQIDKLKREKELFNYYKNTYDEIESYIKQIYNNIVNDLQQQLEYRKNIADKIISIYKDVYEKQKEIALDAIDEELDELEKSHQEKMDYLDEELSKYEEIIDAKLKSIEEADDERTYKKQLSKLQNERQEIENRISVLKLDDSYEAQSQLVELREQRDQKEEEIEELQYKRQTDLRKENLQEQLKDYKKDIDNKKKSENDKYNKEKERLDKIRQETERHYENLLNDERKFAQMREDILQGNLENIQASFETFKNFIQSNSKIIGDSLSQNLIDKINEANAVLSGIDYSQPIRDDGGSSDSGSSPSSKQNRFNIGGHEYAVDAKGNIYKKKGDAFEWIPPENYKYIPDQVINRARDIKIMHSGGIIGEENGTPSKVVQLVNKLLNTKANEQVIKGLKDEIMTPPQNIGQHLIPNLRNMFNSMQPLASIGGNVNNYNLNMNFEGFKGTKKDADYVFSTVMKGLKKIGKK